MRRLVGLCVAVGLVAVGVWLLRPKSIPQTVSNTAQPVIPSALPHPTPIPAVVVPPPPSPVVLTFVGDIMLDRDVWDRMRQSGADYPFRKIGDLFTGSDVVIANLEGPVTTRGSHSVVGGPLIFTFDPSVTASLKEAGITAVSLANNHTFNQGQAGLDETRANLTAVAIPSFGDPRKVDAAFVHHLVVHDKTVSLIGWNTIEIADNHLGDLLELVRAEQSANDFVVVMPHWGVEYQQQTQRQISQAHQLIDAGADLVIGAHPHVVQGIEHYHEHLIVYSMGNFIFDQYWSVPTQRAIAVRYSLDTDTQTATVIPLQLDHAQPTKATGSVRDGILQQLHLNSDTISIP